MLDCILSVSEADLVYFKKEYPNTPSVYLPSFHALMNYNANQEKGITFYITVIYLFPKITMLLYGLLKTYFLK
jgi:hypothetical protein